MLFVFRCNLKLLKPIFFFELILVCGSEVTKKFSVRVRERDDNTDPTLSSNEREGLSCLSPPMRGIRRRRHKQRVEAEKNFEFSLSFIFFSLKTAVMVTSKHHIALFLKWKCLGVWTSRFNSIMDTLQ